MSSTSMPDYSESLNSTYAAYLDLTSSEFYGLKSFVLWRLSQFDSLKDVNIFELIDEVLIRYRKAKINTVIEKRLSYLKGIAQNIILEMNRKKQKYLLCQPDYFEGILTSNTISTAIEVEDEVISLDAGNFTQIQLYHAIERLLPDRGMATILVIKYHIS
jgi:hypothetical protein